MENTTSHNYSSLVSFLVKKGHENGVLGPPRRLDGGQYLAGGDSLSSDSFKGISNHSFRALSPLLPVSVGRLDNCI